MNSPDHMNVDVLGKCPFLILRKPTRNIMAMPATETSPATGGKAGSSVVKMLYIPTSLPMQAIIENGTIRVLRALRAYPITLTEYPAHNDIKCTECQYIYDARCDMVLPDYETVFNRAGLA